MLYCRTCSDFTRGERKKLQVSDTRIAADKLFHTKKTALRKNISEQPALSFYYRGRCRSYLTKTCNIKIAGQKKTKTPDRSHLLNILQAAAKNGQRKSKKNHLLTK